MKILQAYNISLHFGTYLFIAIIDALKKEKNFEKIVFLSPKKLIFEVS